MDLCLPTCFLNDSAKSFLSYHKAVLVERRQLFHAFLDPRAPCPELLGQTTCVSVGRRSLELALRSPHWTSLAARVSC